MEINKTVKNECHQKEIPYLDETQLNYFKNKLIGLKINLVEKIYQNKTMLKTMREVYSDILDKSNSMVAIEHEIRSQERHHGLLKQIDAALKRIEEGNFGYCKITGMPIGLKRLESLPYTALSMAALQDNNTWQ
ncbi:MAG: transcriptional regulator, TraR/DksA family protein [Desulfobacula sp.]|mgnify:CR=1 FL=1|jgi:DnaK suppressor protein|uniref:TraR/DksA family transcriptional regulator n=1 Tax=Desulfobacula sp. TaxID=2593537 RepID=UPI001ED35AF8|nr:transcriptional regulator, TraR/DksA family protein [Desulfobacula sp.]MBT4876296.1 transcriptional regulator, TraR/DksA family protein [Desulfobacula sp.]MBT5546468.1 transcriptional regulator, TraR/DksA family protein [Desulfobacula sp.]MBT5972717.1 transcriptional regulator, TraR/DksA family protein [Desulfobacula sp.]MBT7712565.1 transcriptional regulator, TraR/DksA family protein [Deltaproteobacteria bacterium]